ncbi:MAG: hypothetical protein NC429_05445, partial [Lachnospiraceae bacterium]|nr:hypothetical protein [Lachnospiraceae bacterium]
MKKNTICKVGIILVCVILIVLPMYGLYRSRLHIAVLEKEKEQLEEKYSKLQLEYSELQSDYLEQSHLIEESQV